MKKASVRFTLILSGEGPLDRADLENMAAVILGQAQAYAHGEWDTQLDSTCLACLHHPGFTPCPEKPLAESTSSGHEPALRTAGPARGRDFGWPSLRRLSRYWRRAYHPGPPEGDDGRDAGGPDDLGWTW